MNRTPTTLDAKLHHYIHAREARTDQENVAETFHAFEGFGQPGIAKITGAAGCIPACQGVAGREVSQGEHDSICQHATATAQMDFRYSDAGSRERERFVSDPFESTSTAWLRRLVQHRLHIVSVNRSRKKAARPSAGIVVCLGPAKKMMRIVCKNAHIPGAYVKQERRALGSIGQPASHGSGLLHHDDGEGGIRASEKLCRQDGAGKTPADDGDGQAGGTGLAGSRFHLPLAHKWMVLKYADNVY